MLRPGVIPLTPALRLCCTTARGAGKEESRECCAMDWRRGRGGEEKGRRQIRSRWAFGIG